jgi:membrane fusion protein, adhesin transport system
MIEMKPEQAAQAPAAEPGAGSQPSAPKGQGLQAMPAREHVRRRIELEFAADAEVAGRVDRSPGWLLFSLGLVALLALALTWAHFFKVEEVASGTARIIPSSREQVLQSLEGGILQEMLVREADTVKKGQVVARIDPTRAESSFKESANRRLALRAQAARLRAESLGQPLTFPPDVLEDPDMVAVERANYVSKRSSLEQSIAGFQRSKALITQELAMAEPMAEKGLVSQTEVIKLRRQANDAELQIIERRNRYQTEAAAELTKLETELASLNETVTSRKDLWDRTELRSPVNGIVNVVNMNTIGGVIQPGAQIMEIMPMEDTLLVEARMKPSDMAFLLPGQPATVKLAAYDYSIYGGLKGHVEYISPGALVDEKARTANPAESTYYRVVVRTDGNLLSKAGSTELRIIPGMTATVDILTGHKTVLDYLLRPLLRVQDAFREK